MPKRDFHDEPYDEGTLAKLDLFQLYARAWYPVFLSSERVFWPEVHVFDFFAGPGKDRNGIPGSPVRIVREALESRHKLARSDRSLHFHFFDSDPDKVESLRTTLAPMIAALPSAHSEIECWDFRSAFDLALPILNREETANLVFLDPCAVNLVDETVFQRVIQAPTTDVLAFVASNFLHRFTELPSIKLKIQRPDDFYHCHKAVLEHFRKLVPRGHRYYLNPFSIRKPTGNIYGVVFGTSHPLGMEKFLNLAWDKDKLNGEANFDIHRDDLDEQAPRLPWKGDLFAPTKLTAFERALEGAILTGQCTDELQVAELCFHHGVKRQHAKPVLKRLVESGQITADFGTPDFRNDPPRRITLS